MHQHRMPRQYSDQIECSYCNKQWDANDPNPPTCEPFTLEIKAKPEDRLKKLRESLNV